MAAHHGVPAAGVRGGSHVEVWGVLNVTPDSFSDGGAFPDVESAVAHAERLVADGADVIDIGGESTRPRGAAYGEGADPVSVEEELRRVLPVIECLRSRCEVRISIDTQKAEVADRALDAGATIVNDVTGGSSDALLRVVRRRDATLVLMHNRGRGEVAAPHTNYGDVVRDVGHELGGAVARARAAGVAAERLWVDPGLGFAKEPWQSGLLLGALGDLRALGVPVLVGASRKGFLAALQPTPSGALLSPRERLAPSIAAAVLAVVGGAQGIRAHDVRETRLAVDLAAQVATLAGNRRAEAAA